MPNALTIGPQLLPPPLLERRCIALAALDAILSPEWQYRYYSFNRHWDGQARTRMASMRNGSGDHYFILFFPDGTAALKGYDHESPALDRTTAIAGVLEGLPPSFAAFANEPAFTMQEVTFCLWSLGERWERSAAITETTVLQDGSAHLLQHLAGSAEDYVAYAREYFEVDVPKHAVVRMLELEPLTRALVTEIRADADLDDLASDIEEIGYPIAG